MTFRNQPEMAVLDWLKQQAEITPAAPALYSVTGVQVLTFADLAQQVEQLATTFAKLGIGRDTKVGVCLKDGPESLMVLMALMSISAVAPIHVTATASHIEHLADALEVSVFVGENRPASPAWKIAEARNQCYIAVHKNDKHFGQIKLKAHRDIQSPSFEKAGLDDIALCISTSGTSGTATVVAISQRSLDLNVSTHARLNGYGPQTRGVCVMSLTYLLAYVRSSLPMLRLGGALSVAPGYRFADMARCCETVKPTCMAATPTILQKFISDAEQRNWRPQSGVLTRFHATGEAIPDSLGGRLDAAFGASFGTNYGMTEVSPQVAVRRPEDTFTTGAVGHVVHPWAVETVDEDGMVLPKGGVGRVALTGGLVNAIVGMTKETRFDAAGRFLTGDRGFVDDAGVLYIVGRADDVINRGGEKLDPKAIEQAFELDPDVDRAVVFGVPDLKLGQKIYGLLVLKHDATRGLDEISASVGDRVAGWGMPERLFKVSDIPTNANGKVSRSDLIERYRDA